MNMKTIRLKQFIFGLIALTMLWFVAPTAQAATGWMRLSSVQYGLDKNCSGTGWTWDVETETLTLTAEYEGSDLDIYCAVSDTIKLTLTGNVTIDGAGKAQAIHCNGSLIINAEGYTLDIVSKPSHSIRTLMGLTFTGGTINTENSRNPAIFTDFGDITISGNTNITTNYVLSFEGELLINTTGTLFIEQYINAKKGITISSGSLFINGEMSNSIESVSVLITGNANVTTKCGIISTLSPLTVSTTGTVDVTSNKYGLFSSSDIYISSGTVNVTSSRPALSAKGTIHVSGGTLTLAGNSETTSGILNHTGGTINGQGPTSSAIIPAETTTVRLHAEGRRIIITGVDKPNVQVFTTGGQLIASRRTNEIVVPQTGIYLVSVDGEAGRIIVIP